MRPDDVVAAVVALVAELEEARATVKRLERENGDLLDEVWQLRETQKEAAE